MANWQDPRPLFPWSAPPESQAPRTAPKIKPNLYARMARYSVQHPVAVLLALVFLIATAATIALLNLRVDLAGGRSGELSAAEQRAAGELAIRYGEIGSIARIRLSASDSAMLAPAAADLAAKLQARTGLVEKVLLPDLQAAAPAFTPYYLDTPELNRRVNAVQSAQAYYQLLSASPTLGGLNGMIATAKGAVEAGQPPGALAPLMDALADATADLAAGRAASMDWKQATGLGAAPALPEVTVLVMRATGDRAAFELAVQEDVKEVVQRMPSLQVQMATSGELGPGASRSTGREFIVALFLSLLFVVSLLAVFLRSPRDVVLVMLAPATSVLTAVALSTFIVSPMDDVLATLPMLLVPGSIVIALCYVLALVRHEKRAISTMSLIMLAAQQSGAATLAMLAVAAVVWLVWLILVPVAALALALCAIAGHVVAAAITLLALPTFAALVPRQKPDFVPAAAANARRAILPPGLLRATRPWAAIALVAATLVCSVLAFVFDGGIDKRHAEQPLQLQAPNYEAAAQQVASLRAEENVGRITWIDDFLPADAEAKRKSLSLLSSIVLSEQVAAETPANMLQSQFASLSATLQSLESAAEAGQPLQLAAARLRRALAMLESQLASPAGAGRKFEPFLAASLRNLAPYLKDMAALPPPAIADLDASLRSLYVADDGTYRIEVWPRPPVSEEQFLATVRAVNDQAIFAGSSSIEWTSAAKWRFLLALGIAYAALFGLSLMVMGRFRVAIELLVSQIFTLLLAAALIRLAGIGPPGQVEAALFAGLSTSCMAGLWVKLAPDNAWILPTSYIYGPLAGAAVLLPVIILGVTGLAGFSHAFLVVAAAVLLIQSILVPQLAELAWVFQLPKPGLPNSLMPRGKKPCAEPQASTKPAPDGTRTT